MLLAYAALAVAATWWGWWLPAPAAAPSRATLTVATPGTPEAVVAAYFHALGRDPLRTLPLLTDAAHRRHGLRLADTAAQEGSRSEGPVERHQLAWLALQKREGFRDVAERLVAMPVAVAQDGHRATVTVEISEPDGAALVQRFALRRVHAKAPWRIDDVTQSGIVDANEAGAFVAWPSEALRARLASPADAP
jgi:hypothetical protein